MYRWIAASLGLVAFVFAARAVLVRWETRRALKRRLDAATPPRRDGAARLGAADRPHPALPAPTREDDAFDVRHIPF